jgi:hypothetical protein
MKSSVLQRGVSTGDLLQRLVCGAILAVVAVLAAGDVQADSRNLAGRRQVAQAELRQFFFRDVQIEATLKSSEGPEWWQRMFKATVYNCPTDRGSAVPNTVSFNFTTSGPGLWVGDIDALNVGSRKATGDVGYGLAVPKASGISNGATHFQFVFDDPIAARRKLIDAAAEKFDRCVRQLPPGSYGANALVQRCPIPEVAAQQPNQTCIEMIDGRILDRLADGSYSVALNLILKCDMISYGKPGRGTPGHIGCYFSTYEGKATLSAQNSSPAVSTLKRAANRAQTRCARVKTRSVNQCVALEMAREITRRR